MAITVGDVVQAARDRHPLFVKPRVPDVVLVRYLSDYQRTLVAKAIQRDAALLLTTQTVTSPDPGTPVTLPAFARVVGGTVVLPSPAPSRELTIVSYSDRFRASGPYVATLTGQTLTFQGDATDWSGVTAVTVQYVAEPVDFTALADVFVLPDSARPALVARCALMAASRVTGLPDSPPVDVTALSADAQEAESTWLAAIGAGRRSRTHRMREVW